MSSTPRAAAEQLVSDLRAIFRDRLQSVVAYGERPAEDSSDRLRCLALVTSLGVDDLDACARSRSAWEGEGLATPLILPSAEFRGSLDAFPLEYAEIIRTHERLYGPDPFEGLEIRADDLRRACETQAKSHLLHLREEYIHSGGRPVAVAELVEASAPAFAALLRQVARLHGSAPADRAAATREGARCAALPEDIVSAVLALEQPSGLGSTDAARLFPEYLRAVERLADFIDSWRR